LSEHLLILLLFHRSVWRLDSRLRGKDEIICFTSGTRNEPSLLKTSKVSRRTKDLTCVQIKKLGLPFDLRLWDCQIADILVSRRLSHVAMTH